MKCARCNKEIPRRPFFRYGERFCSKACANKYKQSQVGLP